jgi:hypothetical protein
MVIEVKELADHPIRVGGYPQCNSQVVAKFRHKMPGPPGDDDGDDQCREDHGYTQGLPDQAPANVLKKPEYDVKVFHFPVAQGDGINRGLLISHPRIY